MLSTSWPVVGWNLGLIRISSEVWPHRASETHTLSLTLPYPDPILCPHHPYPGNGRFGDFRGGQRGPVAEASGHRGHSGGTNISFSAAPCGTQHPAPNALPQCLLYRGEERGGGRTQTMLPFKALPSPQWGGEVWVGKSAWGRATPSPKTSHSSATAWLCISPEAPRPKEPGRFPATLELVWRFSEVNK